MNSIYIYDFDWISSDLKRQRNAVVFCGEADPGLEEAREEIDTYFDAAMPSDEVFLLLCDATSEDKLRSFATREGVPDAIPGSDNGTTTHLLTFDERGTLWRVSLHEDDLRKEKLKDETANRLRHQGLLQLFRRRHGILEASTTHHYAKPSRKHCNQFIRTGNVLNSSGEINFVALCLLPHIGEEVRSLYCDTSSINSVAYAIAYLRSHFGSTTNHAFVIDSFGSYEGLRNFKFHDASHAVVLISASTSGDLVDEILKKDSDLERNNVITLFYLADERKQTQGRKLCKLHKTQDNPQGYDLIVSYEPDDCALCRKGSMCVKIVGDQFLPENPNVSTHLVRAKDVPTWLSRFLQEFKGSGVIRCYHNTANLPEHPTQKKREIFLDLAPFYEDDARMFIDDSKAINTKSFSGRWQKTLSQNVPSCLTRIVHLDDRASESLARRVLEHFQKSNAGNSPQMMKASLLRGSDVPEDNTGASLVVCGCMSTGRKLMSVSQSLRNVQTNGAIAFLIGVSRTPSKQAFDDIKSNLTYGDFTGDYGFSGVKTINCRDNADQVETSWDQERRFLNKFRNDESEKLDEPTLTWIEHRLGILQSAGERRGLVNDVFCSRPNEDALALRRNMVFVTFDYKPGDITQAEVYFTVSAVLHALRQPHRPGEDSPSSRLIQHEHHRVLLSPQCFTRFNDGIIQAAFLRAANQDELDYHISPLLSEEMLEVLTPVFENWNNDIGEACAEFLLALATEKLQLADKDTRQLLDAFKLKSGVPKHLLSLSEFILGRIK